MKARSVVTVLLLLFVACSVAYMGIKEMRAGRGRASQAANTESRSTPAQSPAEGYSGTDAGATVIAYYFHGDKRCPTCMKLEAYAKEALEADFRDEFDSGRLEWRVVNVDRPENEHFIKDFQLVTKSLVLVDMHNGEQAQWRNLERIWDLVHDKSAYLKYVCENARDLLEAAS